MKMKEAESGPAARATCEASVVRGASVAGNGGLCNDLNLHMSCPDRNVRCLALIEMSFRGRRTHLYGCRQRTPLFHARSPPEVQVGFASRTTLLQRPRNLRWQEDRRGAVRQTRPHGRARLT